MSLSDKEMIVLCKNNRREGYELLFTRYQRYIYSLCYNYIGLKEDALDLTQEIYIKLYRSMGQFDESRPLAPWIKRIAVNTCLNFVEREAKSAKECALTEGLAQELAGDDSPEAKAIGQSTRRSLEEAIRFLPEKERMAIILKHVQDMSYAEIGSAMGCPLGTVKTYIYRGRGMLRETLKASGVWEG